jgi:hypothetical protein
MAISSASFGDLPDHALCAGEAVEITGLEHMQDAHLNALPRA